MITTKAPMTNSYRAIFIFAIVMSFATLLAGNKGGIGTLFWGYVAWMMYKRNFVGLVTLFKLSLGLVFFSFFIGFVLLSNGTFEEKWFGYTPQGYYLTVLIVGAIDLALLSYFKNLTNQADLAYRPSDSQIPSSEQLKSPFGSGYIDSNDNKLWEDALFEFNNKRNEGLWGRLFSESDGDENKAKARYLKSYVERIQFSKINSVVAPVTQKIKIADEEESFIACLMRGDAATIGSLIGLALFVWLIFFGGIFKLTGTKPW